MTNYERVKQMTIEEMHEFLCEVSYRKMAKGLPLDLPDRADLSYNDEILIWLNGED